MADAARRPAAARAKAGRASGQAAPAGKGKEEAAKKEPTEPLKRVLVLTGPASGEKIMKTQLSKLIKKAEGQIDFIVYEGERECTGGGTSAEAVEIMSQFFKGLPMKMYDELEFDERNWRCYKDVRQTLATMQAAMKERAPIDGVLGFSMGANFAVMLAAQSAAGKGMPLKFVIPMCPNAPGFVDQVRDLFVRPVDTPALIIRGAEETYSAGLTKTLAGKEVDTLDEPIVSEHVVKLFKDPEVYTHPDGHRALPAKPKEQDKLVDKVIEFVMQKSAVAPVVRDPNEPSGLPMWRVPDQSGGRVVRWGESLESKERSDTLRPGALVEEIELKGTRLHYHLIAGSGPTCGWVTTQSTKGKLLVRAPADAAGTTGEIWIMTIGTRGDLQPFVVLGMALKAAGYSVRLFGPPELSAFSSASGLRVTTICRGWSDRSQAGLQVVRPQATGEAGAAAAGDRDWGEMEAALQENAAPVEGEIPGVKQPQMGWANFFGLLAHLGVDTNNGGDVVNLAWLWNEMPKAIQTMMEIVQADGKPDMLIYNHLMVNVGLLMWRLYGIRSLFANLGLEFHFAPRGEDSFNYNTLGAFDRMEVKRLTKGIVPMLDMSKEQFNALYNSKDRLLGTTKLIIYALPHEDQKVAKDWKFTGFWIYDEEKQKDETAVDAFGGTEVLDRLKEFLLDGDAPAYMGWGSMPTLPGLILVLMQALISLKARAVMVRGWGNLSLDALRQAASEQDPERCEELCAYAQENVLFVDKAPHEWLLPRCSCCVHHGGAGTTAAGMRAGIPTIVVPLGYDQPIHGEWVQKLGVGVACSKMDVLTASEFEEALRKATSSADMRAKARNTADTLRKEPGVSAAVDKIRKIMRDDVRTLKAKERWEAENEERSKTRKRDNFWTTMKEEEAKRKEEEAKKRAEEGQKEEEDEKERKKEARRQKYHADEGGQSADPQPSASPKSANNVPLTNGRGAEAEALGKGYQPKKETTRPPTPPTEPETEPQPAKTERSPVAPVKGEEPQPDKTEPPPAGKEVEPQPAETERPPAAPVEQRVEPQPAETERPPAAPVEERVEPQPAETERPPAAPVEERVEPQPAATEQPPAAPAEEREGREEREGGAPPPPPADPGGEGDTAPPGPLGPPAEPVGGLSPGAEPPPLQPSPPVGQAEEAQPERLGADDAQDACLRHSSNHDDAQLGDSRAVGNVSEELPMGNAGAQQGRHQDEMPSPEVAKQCLAAPSELVIYIDRSLDLKTTVSLRPDMVVLDVKILLANDDPTGETKPGDFKLVDPLTGRELSDTVPITGDFTEVEISVDIA